MGYLALLGFVSLSVFAARADYLFEVADLQPKDVTVEFPVCVRDDTYYLPHESYCDLFYTCHQRHATMGQCDDGLVFDLDQGCRMYHAVDCAKRPKLQYPKGSGNCPRQNGIFRDPRGCGFFYKCSNGTAFSDRCPQGQMFEDTIKGCRLGTEREMYDCNTPSVAYQTVGSLPVEPKPVVITYQEYPKGSGNCPRQNGIFRDPRGCGFFYKCSNGTAFSDRCPQGQMFEDTIKGCRLGTEREMYDCNTPSVAYQAVGSLPVEPKPVVITYQVAAPETAYTGVAGFECPKYDVYPYGEHSRHPYPGSCIQYIMCMRDKTMKVGSCYDGFVYNPRTGTCGHPESVPGCF